MALEDFQFGVKALSDAVVAREAPHGGDLMGPGMQGFAQVYQLREAGLSQLVNGPQQTGR